MIRDPQVDYSEQRPIHAVLHDVMVDVQAVPKSDRNTQQGFEFRGIDAIINAVGPAFRTHHVVVIPLAVETRYRDVTTAKDKPARECMVMVTYRFYGPAGDFLDVQVPGEALDMGDKGTAKAMSVAYRIALIQALCLPTGDHDPDQDTYERAPAEAEPSESEKLKGQIRNVAKAKEIRLEAIAEDFLGRTKVSLRETTDVTLLSHYLGHLRTQGIPKAVKV